MKAKQIIFKKQFQNLPKISDFQIVEENLPSLNNGDVLFEAMYISVDPYMRAYASQVPTGNVMFGDQVAKVLDSKHPDYKVGDIVVGFFGWTTHCVLNPDKLVTPFGESKPYILPDIGGFSPSTALGILGMPGNTAYFGLTKILEPKAGEVLVVTGAAGAVGTVVGQLGKILGLTVIGFAGTDEKVKILKDELNFDFAYNYKTVKVTEVLKEAAPNGVDCYFDNVGGTISSEIMYCMNTFGRVAVCGAISVYNSDRSTPELAPVVQPAIVMKQLTVKGFIVMIWKNIWFHGIEQNLKYMKEGKLKDKETIFEGFEKTPEAFIGLFSGANIGKAVVKI